MQDLKSLLNLLASSDVDFVLVGGFAGVVHGSTQVTQDIDICMAITDSEVFKLRDALKDLNPEHRMNPSFKPSFLEYPENLHGVNNIYLNTKLGVLDIMSKLPPVGDFERIKKNSVEVPLFGQTVRVISIDDLIEIKRSMTRPKDKQVLNELEEIKKLK